MINRIHHFAAAVLAILAVAALVEPISSARAAPAERFEVTSLKAVRPTLVNTLDAVQKRDAAAARDAFGAYDSAWNGIEVDIRYPQPADVRPAGAPVSAEDHQGARGRNS